MLFFPVYSRSYYLVTIALSHDLTVVGETWECILSKKDPSYASTQNGWRTALIFIYVCIVRVGLKYLLISALDTVARGQMYAANIGQTDPVRFHLYTVHWPNVTVNQLDPLL